MQMITSKNVFHIIRKTLNLVDMRLVTHGERVAFILYKMLQYQGMACDKRMLEFVILAALSQNIFLQELENLFQYDIFDDKEKNNFLHMIAYAIDFRSDFMVAHTVTTVCVSWEIASLLQFPWDTKSKLYYGALLHDIGKVAIPIEVLEKEGKLTSEEMDMMRRHVLFTEEILKDFVPPDIYRIAVRHHEKMDGSGYPKGLDGTQLSAEERIVAIADIMSALLQKRSYKEAFSREKTMGILLEMKKENKICPCITDYVLDNFPQIIEKVEQRTHEFLKIYQGMKQEYLELISFHIQGNSRGYGCV